MGEASGPPFAEDARLFEILDRGRAKLDGLFEVGEFVGACGTERHREAGDEDGDEMFGVQVLALPPKGATPMRSLALPTRSST